MNPSWLTPFIGRLSGSAGGVRAVYRNGNLTFAPLRKRQLSQSPAAKRIRQVYAAVEHCWNSLTGAERALWLFGCRVPGLSGRDLWGRVNFHQVMDYGGFYVGPPVPQACAPVRIRLVPLRPLPAGALGGGPENTRAWQQDGVWLASRERIGSAPGLTPAQAVASATLSALSSPWHDVGTLPRAQHTAVWDTHPFLYAVVRQREATYHWTEEEHEYWWDLAPWLDFDFHTVGEHAEAAQLDVSRILPADGWQRGNALLQNGPATDRALTVTDGTGWQNLGPASAPGMTRGWQTFGARFTARVVC